MRNTYFRILVAFMILCLLPAVLPADEAAPPKEPGKPVLAENAAEAVNGLKAELTVVNAPLYPGDDLQLDARLTNVQKDGDIQIVDYPMHWVCFNFIVIGPDGQQITWPEPEMAIKQPEAPSATLPPGGFYGRKITLGATQMTKPGRYAISVRYSNGEALKDKGFNCWTGNVQSNTAFFEVPDFSNVPAVDGIKLLVKMKPQYREDEPVMIEVRLYNSSDKEKEINRLPDAYLQELSSAPIKDAKGNEVPYLPAAAGEAPPLVEVKLEPGEADTKEFCLSGARDLAPGKYTAQLHSQVSMPNAGLVNMVSNEVSFEILAAEKPGEAPVKDGVQMVLTMSKERYAADEKVEFTIHMKNASNEEKSIYAPNDEHFTNRANPGHIIKADGTEVQWKIKYVRHIIKPNFKALKPGEENTFTYDLRPFAELAPGEYTLQLIAENAEFGKYESNKVKFEILPAEKPPEEPQPAP
jgi:hypothetical protein